MSKDTDILKSFNIDSYELAPLKQKSTNLPMVVWICEKGRSKPGPRIIVCRTLSRKIDISDIVSVKISDDPEIEAGSLNSDDLELIRLYIKLNKKTLLQYWEGEIDAGELVERLKPIPV